MGVSGEGRAAAGPRLSTRSWFTMTLAIMAVLLAVSAVLGTWALSRSTSTFDQMTTRISPGLLWAERLRGALLDQEAGVHGYIVSGRREFADGFDEGQVTERTAVAELRRSLAGSPLLADLDAVELRAGDWRAAYARPTIETVRTRGPGTTDPAQVGNGKALFDRIKAAMDEQTANLTLAQRRATADIGQARMWRNTVLTGVLVMFVITLIAVALLLRYAVLGPLDRLGTAARRVADGDFSHEIDIRGPKDLTTLASDVDAMRRRISEALGVSRDAQRLLQEQADELRRSNSELEQFAYVASHDLQEPVRKVTAFCQLLQRRYADRLDERANEYIAFAVDGAKRMQSLIAELLTFSRVGRDDAERVPVPLDRPLDQALANLESLTEDTGAVVVRSELPEVVGDPALLAMLWQNLIGNAMKFRSPARPPQIQITAERAGDMWEVAVADNGIGVEARFADKIFVIFQRLHNRGEYEGTGIGLALCKKIVEYHGGEIRLDVERGEGTRFVFTLPAVPVPGEIAAAPGPVGVPGSR
ncbi:sensor histidine kinase [Sphaerisporangium sp. NPDC004334]